MDETTRLAIENYMKLNDNQRRGFNVRINGEEHSAESRDGAASIYFPIDGQLMYVAELAMKIIINDGIAYGGGDSSGNACNNWSYGYDTYKTLQEWLRRYEPGSKVDVDCWEGCQCWDYAAAFWRAQVNRNLQTKPGGKGYAWQCWAVSKEVNAGTEFELIYRWQDIKAGDWVIWGNYGTGHIAMALEDYNPQSPITINFRQQDGTTPQRGVFDGPLPFEGLASGDGFNNDNSFQGAFRYKSFHKN